MKRTVSTQMLQVGDVITGSERADVMIPFKLTVISVEKHPNGVSIGLRFAEGGIQEWFNSYWDWHIEREEPDEGKGTKGKT